MKPKAKPFTPEQLGLESPVKLTFIGDSLVGKTVLLGTYRNNEYWENDRNGNFIHVLDAFTTPVKLFDREDIWETQLWDTVGTTDFDKLRPLAYPKTDCFVICFAKDDRASFTNLKDRWIPELNEHSPDVPYIYVCTKMDLFESENVDQSTLIPKSEINEFLQGTQALDYVECSSKYVDSLNSIMVSALNAIITNYEKKKALKQANSWCSIC